MNKRLSEMMLMIQHKPKLSYIKPEILEKINENRIVVMCYYLLFILN